MAGFLGGITNELGKIVSNPLGALGSAISQGSADVYDWMHPYQSPQLTHPPVPGSSVSPTNIPNLLGAQQAYNNIIYQAPPNLAGTVHPYNTSSAYASAQAAAKAQVDPMYQKMIQEFNQSIGAQQQQAQEQNQLSLGQIQAGLQDTLQQNQITGQRTGEDTTNALSNLANAQQNYKQTEGLSFDQAQRALTGQLGASGTATSGVGQGQVAEAQQKEALGQQAQGQQYQVQRQAEQLFANRTFEDLARSGGIAEQQAGLSTKQANLDLDKMMTQLATTQQQQLNQYSQLEQQQLQAATAANYDLGLNQFLSGLAGRGVSSADIAATGQTYRPM